MTNPSVLASTRRLAFLFALTACHAEGQRAETAAQPPPPTCPAGSTFDGHQCVSSSTAPGGSAPPTSTTPAPPSGPTTSQPSLDAGLPTVASHEPGTPLDEVSARAASALIDALAAERLGRGARGMGPLVAGTFLQGQALDSEFEAVPGKCYSVVGAGLLPVSELDLSLAPSAAISGAGAMVLAEDKTTGPEAILGAPPSCFKWPGPFAVRLRLILTVRAGQGVAAARIYEM